MNKTYFEIVTKICVIASMILGVFLVSVCDAYRILLWNLFFSVVSFIGMFVMCLNSKVRNCLQDMFLGGVIPLIIFEIAVIVTTIFFVAYVAWGIALLKG